MSYQNRLERLFGADPIDVTLAKVGVLFCTLLLGLRLFASQELLVVIPVAAGTACLIYVVTRRRQASGFAFPSLPGTLTGFLPSVVFLCLAALVGMVHVYGGRTGPVYLLTGIIGSLILIQILLVDEDDVAVGPVLLEILVAAVVIRLTVLFSTPGFVGVDAWSHIPVYAGGIAETGSISAMEGTKYLLAPFYHLIGAVAALVFGSARTGAFLSIGLFVPLSAILVYGTTNLLIPSRWALLATALYAFSDQFIRWGIHLIPTSLGLVFFLGALYCVTKLFFTDDLRIVGLLLAFSLATVYTHQVSTAIVLLLLGAAAFAAAGLSVTGHQTDAETTRSTAALVGVFVVSLAVTLVTWANTPWSAGSVFLWRMLEILQVTIVESAGFLNLAGESGPGGAGAGQTTGVLAQVIPYVEWFGFALLLLIAVLGGLVMLRKEEPTDLALTYLLTAGGMFFVVFGLSLFGIRSFLPGRWYAFMYAPMAIVGAVGLYYVSRNASRKLILAVFVVLAFGYPTTMVVAEKATLDEPAFEGEYPRYSYTETEIAAVETVSTIRPPETEAAIRTDHPYRTVYRRYGGYEAPIAEVGENGPADSTTTVYRDYQSTAPTTIYESGDPPISRSSNTFAAAPAICPPDRNHVYANEDVRVCTSTAVTAGVAE